MQNLSKFEIFIKFSLIKSSEIILLFLNFENILENKGVISFNNLLQQYLNHQPQNHSLKMHF